MEWTEQQAEFEPGGFDPEGFVVEGVDAAGVRTILFGFQPPGTVRRFILAIDVGFETGIDVAVVTDAADVGLVRMREIEIGSWMPVTDLVATTWRRAGILTTLNVELELTVPQGKPRDILLRQLWNLPGSL